MSPRNSFAAFLGVLVLAALTIDRTAALQADRANSSHVERLDQ